MIIKDIVAFLETIAPTSLQESYDNAGLIVGNAQQQCSGAVVCLDVTEAVLDEAIAHQYNLIIAHHPIVFTGLKKLNGKNYVERIVIKAIQHNIALYAIHTNLDNVLQGVNAAIAAKLGLTNTQVLLPKNAILQKLVVFVPQTHVSTLQEALFKAGAGNIGHYSECSFTSTGIGSFKPGDNTNPYIGTIGERYTAEEVKLEVVFESWQQANIVTAMVQNHPYEEVAYEIYTLQNTYQQIGSGLVGQLTTAITETTLLALLGQQFNPHCIKHTQKTGKPIQKIALCGGAGSFLIAQAKAVGADVYITADLKYHEFFDADNQLLLVDIGHYESEQFTIELLFELLSNKFLNFALLKTGVNTNPVQYFVP
ncbi:Nif3-like dinuclear metal center hexameric protein [Ferruginibacter yonginensis]|uniref:GTP cyclohydrolase 1 type 2 homolog n=1 Tax=Ferruginibacter yonginensis TaxID=1310416 RepID=A0ABV8QR71_9BACT